MFGEFVVEGAAAGVGGLGGPVDAAAGQPGWFSLTGVLHAFSLCRTSVLIKRDGRSGKTPQHAPHLFGGRLASQAPAPMASAIGLSPCEPIHPAKKRVARCQGEPSGRSAAAAYTAAISAAAMRWPRCSGDRRGDEVLQVAHVIQPRGAAVKQVMHEADELLAFGGLQAGH
jgi:hypothetical protein